MGRFESIKAQNVLSELGVEVLRRGMAFASFSLLGNEGVIRKDSDFVFKGSADSFVEIEKGITLKNLSKTKEVMLSAAISVSQSKNIVKTAINGVKGTIKEYIADGDLVINMNVVLGGLEDKYPLEDLKRLQSILDENNSIYIYSNVLNDVLEVTRVVVEGYTFNPTMWSSVQEVKIDLCSDMTFKIEEKIDA